MASPLVAGSCRLRSDGSATWTAPDIIVRNHLYLSAAISVHVVPCTGAACLPVPADPCFDRVHDGDETGRCDAGTCTAPSCSDGIEDGFETGIDCGGTCIEQCF